MSISLLTERKSIRSIKQKESMKNFTDKTLFPEKGEEVAQNPPKEKRGFVVVIDEKKSKMIKQNEKFYEITERTAQKKKNTSIILQKKPIIDDRIIEGVILSRNEEYETIINGKERVRTRKLPRDRESFLKSSSRLFFWG